MARMLPSFEREFKSDAERKIYGWFEKDPVAANWTVCHSFPLEKVDGHLQGEIDFLVFAPRLGIFSLEVKGGRVSRQDDGWHFVDRNNKETIKKRGPFEQASDGIHAIMDYIGHSFGFDSPYSRVLFGYGVMFPDILFDQQDPGWTQEEIFDSRDYEEVGKYLMSLAKFAAQKWEKTFNSSVVTKLPTEFQINAIVDKLRPFFDLHPLLTTMINGIEEQLVALTAEQYHVLDWMATNPRLLVTGGAGTGKTLLAIEEAIRFKDDNIAFFCFNSNLAAFLRKVIQEKVPGFKGYVGTIHSYLLGFIGKSGVSLPDSALLEPGFFDGPGLDLFRNAFEKSPVFFDRLIIDEAQDILTPVYLDLLSLILDCGLSQGKWSFFGDFSNQAIYRTFSEDIGAVDYLKQNYPLTEVTLTVNCRNSYEICHEIENDTRMIYRQRLHDKPSGIRVLKQCFSSADNEAKQIRQILAELQNKGISGKDIAILSPHAYENSSAINISQIKPYLGPGCDGPFFETIHSFKGLESKVVLLIDIKDYTVSRQLVYIGLSRARDVLYIFESAEAREEREILLIDNGKGQ